MQSPIPSGKHVPKSLTCKDYTHRFRIVKLYFDSYHFIGIYVSLCKTVDDITVFDMYPANDRWKANPVSRVYDYKLIGSRLEHLRKAREADDVDCMIYMLRGGLLRNFGGICDKKLFSHSYLG